ncbi:MAG: NUDIX hydrolase [Oscillospiraceae bacterium]
MSHSEDTLEEKTIYSGKVFTVKERISRLEDGRNAQRELVFHNGGASVLPLDEKGNVYLVKQFRSPFECEVLEVPAGKLEKGEDPFLAAKRELKEETGFVAEKYISLGEIWPTVGYCNEKIYMYLAQGLTKGENSFDEDEFLSLYKMPFDSAYKMCLDGTIVDGKTLASIMKVKGLLGL